MAKKGIGSTIGGSVKSVYGDLSPRAKNIVVITGVIVGSILLFKVIKNLKGLRERVAARDEAQATADELEEANQSVATKQKLTNAQVLAIANSMYAAMDGKGTYEDVIYSGFKQMSNNADFLAVVKAYGIRTVHSKVYFISDVVATLVPALQSELSQGWLDYINELLQSKGIKYRV
jgi:CO dehydrogenase/acetyl-CoA synthase epsilon subunit